MKFGRKQLIKIFKKKEKEKTRKVLQKSSMRKQAEEMIIMKIIEQKITIHRIINNYKFRIILMLIIKMKMKTNNFSKRMKKILKIRRLMMYTQVHRVLLIIMN